MGRLRGVSVDPMVALSALDLDARAAARLPTLSGGEQQRLAIAAASVGPPALIVADEPTAELDDDTADLVLTHLRACAGAGSGVVLATHDARVVAVADTVLHLRRGVLSGTRDAGRAHSTAIDGIGRLQLPEDALLLFPTGRAVVAVRDGYVELRPDAGPGSDGPS
jgi:putative ABC transport system ATP-binding protein